MSSRKFFVGGNWKMNGSVSFTDSLLKELNAGGLPNSVDVLVAPPSVYLSQAQSKASSQIKVSAQNCWKDEKGAFTGEVSPEMIKDLGLEWVILGHSERRNIFGESNEIVGKKTEAALKTGLNVVFCCGELLEDRESGKTDSIVQAQLRPLLSLNKADWSKIVIAYEPVWAIGTGKVASPEQAQDTHASIRKWLRENVDKSVADSTRIIYGGKRQK
eukprot:TRINITY_DN2430_c0_g1_i2.p1 TRINITY_DN2430_c0_g1~~TRINITY_DN2430_c0_g1_i2.p1  ORF type:complete len:216 (+),score=57.75 TRINITY_DN2430_c0_g1_i2:39-686(+)